MNARYEKHLKITIIMLTFISTLTAFYHREQDPT
jgi:hypothetical protein